MSKPKQLVFHTVLQLTTCQSYCVTDPGILKQNVKNLFKLEVYCIFFSDIVTPYNQITVKLAKFHFSEGLVQVLHVAHVT